MAIPFTNQILNVDISTYVNAAIFRHLTMFGKLKCNVYMLPVQETLYLSKDVDLSKLLSFDFSIELQRKVFEFKLMIAQESKCKALLTPEFAKNIIWALDDAQDYDERINLINPHSYNYVYEVEIEGEKKSEILYFNINRVEDI